MTVTDAEQFRTEVRGSSGIWPKPPLVWSYTSLRNAEECPRRWMLGRATYPQVWEKSGYPPKPILPALLGDIIHRALQLILHALYLRSCPSVADACAVQVLKELGGYSLLVERVIEEQMQPHESNPRLLNRIDTIRSNLRSRVPQIRQRVQVLVSRASLTGAAPSLVRSNSTDGSRGPLVEGSHPEVELRADQLRLMGRADLLTISDGNCVITDYKTGTPKPHHADQLRTYALLWRFDDEINPQQLSVGSLILAYSTHDERIDPPSPSQLDRMANELKSRIVKTEEDLKERPPPARPFPEMCRFCSVRQLCEDYWEQLSPGDAITTPSNEENFVDCEGIIADQNGPRSWIVALEPQDVQVLLRTSTESPGFKVGDRVRLLDAAFSREEDNQAPVLTLTQVSEVFQMDPSKVL